MSSFAERLTRAMQEKNYTLEQLAEKSHISKSTIQRYTTGQTKNVPIEKARALADALGVTYGYISGWEEAPSTPTIEDYEKIGAAARMKTAVPSITPEGILAQLQSLERQLKTQISLSATEQQLISDFRALPRSAQGKVRAYIDGLFDRLEGK